MVISCWPTATFCPGCADRCPTSPLLGATMVVYCRFNSACCSAAAELWAWATAASARDFCAEICSGRVWALFTEAAAVAILALRSEEHTSELQSHLNLVCRLLLEKKNKHTSG